MGDRHGFSHPLILFSPLPICTWCLTEINMHEQLRKCDKIQCNHTRMKGATMRILSGFVILPYARIFCLVGVQCGFSCLTVPGLTIRFNVPIDKKTTAGISGNRTVRTDGARNSYHWAKAHRIEWSLVFSHFLGRLYRLILAQTQGRTEAET